MDEFKKQRVLVVMVSVLIVLNLAALGTLWMNLTYSHQSGDGKQIFEGPRGAMDERLPGGPDGGGFSVLCDRLGLSQDQMRQVRESRRDHFQEVRDLEEQVFQARRLLQKAMFAEDPNQMQIETLTQRVGAIQAKMELLRLQHFQSILSLCDEQQREKFKKMIHDILSNIQPPRDGLGPEPGGPGPLGPNGRRGGPPPFRGDGPDGPPQ